MSNNTPPPEPAKAVPPLPGSTGPQPAQPPTKTPVQIATAPVPAHSPTPTQGAAATGTAGLDKEPIAAVITQLGVNVDQGLSASEAQSRLAKYGPNAVVAKHESLWRKLLGYFTGPIAYMIEAAALVSAILGHWPDFIIIVALLVINAGLGYWQDRKAANALAVLQKGLAPTATVLRDGKWSTIQAATLVPGDVVRMRLGDIVPADVRVVGTGQASIDQSALTGESLPVDKKEGDQAYSGSIVRDGEIQGVVIATGAKTYLGRTAKLVAGAHSVSHAQKAMFQIGNFLIIVAVVLALILVVVQVWRDVAGHHWRWDDALSILQFILVLLVASIPVAMPAVFSVTMALGAQELSKKKAIVSRLESIEELAGVDILCSDKTGTLTFDAQDIVDIIPVADQNQQDIIVAACLASQASDGDPIDTSCFTKAGGPQVVANYKIDKFVSFDPSIKRSSAVVTDSNGKTYQVAKGSTNSILSLTKADKATTTKVEAIVTELANTAHKSLAVARSTDEAGTEWEILGILSMFDQPRPDAKETIQDVIKKGVAVKMVTGDATPIAVETAKELGMGTNILSAPKIFPPNFDPDHVSPEIAKLIAKADGFAEVFPQHKYAIVKSLQQQGHLVAMTGDGVNDSPALKQADCGIAVSDAVAAARSAAALILTAPGLTVIDNAVSMAREIFGRITSYTIYRVALTINIMFLVVLASIFLDFAPLTAIMIVVISLLDDVPIMTIAYDHQPVTKTPIRWQMGQILGVSGSLGVFAVVQSFIALLVANSMVATHTLGITSQDMVQTVVFIQIVCGGHFLVFICRNERWFWRKPFPAWQLWGTIFAMLAIAIAMSGFGWLVTKIPWAVIGIVIGYNIVWAFVMDIIRIVASRVALNRSHNRVKHANFLNHDLRKTIVESDGSSANITPDELQGTTSTTAPVS